MENANAPISSVDVHLVNVWRRNVSSTAPLQLSQNAEGSQHLETVESVLPRFSDKDLVQAFEACCRGDAGRVSAADMLRAVLSGSHGANVANVQRRVSLFRAAVRQLNAGVLADKAASHCTDVLLPEIDTLPKSEISEIIEAILYKKGGLCHRGDDDEEAAVEAGAGAGAGAEASAGADAPPTFPSLDFLPKLLSCICECGQEDLGEQALMDGDEFQNNTLQNICSSPWPPAAAVGAVMVLKDVVLTNAQRHMVALKALRLLAELELAAVPPLLYQLLVLSTQGEGVRLVVLKGLLAHFERLRLRIECRRSGSGSGSRDDEEVEHTEQLLDIFAPDMQDPTTGTGTTTRMAASAVADADAHVVPSADADAEAALCSLEGTVVLHFNFAVKQDHQLGTALLGLLKQRASDLEPQQTQQPKSHRPAATSAAAAAAATAAAAAPSSSFSPFSLALLLSTSRLQRFESPSQRLVADALVSSFTHAAKLRHSAWLRKHVATAASAATAAADAARARVGGDGASAGAVADQDSVPSTPESVSVQQPEPVVSEEGEGEVERALMSVVHRSAHGWDHISQSLVRLGVSLMQLGTGTGGPCGIGGTGGDGGLDHNGCTATPAATPPGTPLASVRAQGVGTPAAAVTASPTDHARVHKAAATALRASAARALPAKERAARVGLRILAATFAAHPLSRADILNSVLTLVITGAPQVGLGIELLHMLARNRGSASIANSMHTAAGGACAKCDTASQLLEQHEKLKQLLEYATHLPTRHGCALLRALRPLYSLHKRHFSSGFDGGGGSKVQLKDYTIVVLRKAIFRREVSARQVAVLGFIQLLEHCSGADAAAGAQAGAGAAALRRRAVPATGAFTLSQPEHFNAPTSPDLDTEVQEFRDTMGFLRRCFGQQPAVRSTLYQGLQSAFRHYRSLRAPIMELLLQHLRRFVSAPVAFTSAPLHDDGSGDDGDATDSQSSIAPLLLERSVDYRSTGGGGGGSLHQVSVSGTATIVEPLPELVSCVMRCALLQTKQKGTGNATDSSTLRGAGADASADMTEPSIRDAAQLLNRLVGALRTARASEFEFDKETCFDAHAPGATGARAKFHLTRAAQLRAVYESAMDFVLLAKPVEQAIPELNDLFRRREALLDLIAQKSSKGKGKGKNAKASSKPKSKSRAKGKGKSAAGEEAEAETVTETGTDDGEPSTATMATREKGSGTVQPKFAPPQYPQSSSLAALVRLLQLLHGVAAGGGDNSGITESYATYSGDGEGQSAGLCEYAVESVHALLQIRVRNAGGGGGDGGGALVDFSEEKQLFALAPRLLHELVSAHEEAESLDDDEKKERTRLRKHRDRAAEALRFVTQLVAGGRSSDVGGNDTNFVCARNALFVDALFSRQQQQQRQQEEMAVMVDATEHQQAVTSASQDSHGTQPCERPNVGTVRAAPPHQPLASATRRVSACMLKLQRLATKLLRSADSKTGNCNALLPVIELLAILDSLASSLPPCELQRHAEWARSTLTDVEINSPKVARAVATLMQRWTEPSLTAVAQLVAAVVTHYGRAFDEDDDEDTRMLPAGAHMAAVEARTADAMSAAVVDKIAADVVACEYVLKKLHVHRPAGAAATAAAAATATSVGARDGSNASTEAAAEFCASAARQKCHMEGVCTRLVLATKQLTLMCESNISDTVVEQVFAVLARAFALVPPITKAFARTAALNSRMPQPLKALLAALSALSKAATSLMAVLQQNPGQPSGAKGKASAAKKAMAAAGKRLARMSKLGPRLLFAVEKANVATNQLATAKKWSVPPFSMAARDFRVSVDDVGKHLKKKRKHTDATGVAAGATGLRRGGGGGGVHDDALSQQHSKRGQKRRRQRQQVEQRQQQASSGRVDDDDNVDDDVDDDDDDDDGEDLVGFIVADDAVAEDGSETGSSSGSSSSSSSDDDE